MTLKAFVVHWFSSLFDRRENPEPLGSGKPLTPTGTKPTSLDEERSRIGSPEADEHVEREIQETEAQRADGAPVPDDVEASLQESIERDSAIHEMQRGSVSTGDSATEVRVSDPTRGYGTVVGDATGNTWRVRFDDGSKWYLPANELSVVSDDDGELADEQVPDTQQSTESGEDRAFEIWTFSDYHPYRGGRNKLFGPDDRRILELKNGEAQAVEYYVQLLAEHLPPGRPIVVIPSHDPRNAMTGMRRVALRLCQSGWEDATDCLVRTRWIPKLSLGGARTLEIQLGSLEVTRAAAIRERSIILLDDVTTTMNSLKAAGEKLFLAGASSVSCYVLGKTKGSR